MTPWDDPLALQPQDSIRRLIDIHYVCPLCSGEHWAQEYLTLKASTIEQYEAIARFFFDLSPPCLRMILTVAVALHESAGYAVELIRALPGQQVPVGITEYTILDESDYTCEHCGSTFPTIAGYRFHSGEDVITAIPTQTQQGIPIYLRNTAGE